LLTARRQDAGVVDRQAELRLEALAFLRRQFRQGGAHVIEERVLDDHRQQVRIGEVTVVVGFLFAAHGAGFVFVRVVQAGLWITLPPSSISSIWRRTSVLIAFSMKRNELTFLISQRVPYSTWPFGRTDTLQSQRSEPSAMLPSQMPR